MAAVDAEKLTSPVQCFCAIKFRPVVLSMSTLNDCKRCDGWGWVEEHEFTGNSHGICTVCGWTEPAHWENAEE